LSLRAISVERRKPLPVEYQGVTLDCGYRLDLVVENAVVVQIKEVAALEPIHEAQVLTHVRRCGWTIGLLININVPVLKEGVKRMVNNLVGNSAFSAPPR
jgi:GxxExxY protein